MLQLRLSIRDMNFLFFIFLDNVICFTLSRLNLKLLPMTLRGSKSFRLRTTSQLQALRHIPFTITTTKGIHGYITIIRTPILIGMWS